MSELSKRIIIFSTEPISSSINYTNVWTEPYSLEECPPKIFNEKRKEKDDGDIYGYLPSQTQIIDDNALTKIENIFIQYPGVCCVYADCIIDDNSTHFSSWNYEICKKHIMNIPLFINSQVNLQFNEQLQYLYNYDYLCQLNRRHLSWHIAEPLFEIQSIQQDSSRLQTELQYILKTYESSS